jgi:hypothetical protein
MDRRYLVRLSAPATIRVHRNGQIVSTSADTDFASIDAGQLLIEPTTVSIERAFPGQVLAYDMRVRYSVSFDEACIPHLPPLVDMDLVEDCPMCGQFLLREREHRVLDPLELSPGPAPGITYYVYAPGGRDLPISIDPLGGESLRAELKDTGGRVLAVADTHGGFLRGGLQSLSAAGPGFSGNGARRESGRLLLSPGVVPEGIYALTLTHFGYDSEVDIILPQTSVIERPRR